MQAVILAAGRGTRLGAITKTRSKGMLPILGKPIVERIIENLNKFGLKDFILVVGPEDREIREYFQREYNLDVNIRFVEQFERLGTADALRQAAPYINEDFVLSACDIICPASEVQRFIATWSRHTDTQGLLSLERISLKDTRKTGIVTLGEGRVTNIIEKPSPDQAPTNISSTPMYIFSTRILDYLPQVPLSIRGEFELQDAIQMMIDDDLVVRGLYLHNRLTLTTAEDLLKLNMYFLKTEVQDRRVEAQEIGPGTQLIDPVYIEQGVVIGAGSKIGPGIYIERDAQVGDRVQLENVVVLRGAVIPDGVLLRDQVVTR
jgi:bifunctional UDP-N-acetylglucosamine pyrophosphorylase/glucosamine-1-phosphate N-acetyltransferase